MLTPRPSRQYNRITLVGMAHVGFITTNTLGVKRVDVNNIVVTVRATPPGLCGSVGRASAFASKAAGSGRGGGGVLTA